MDLFRYELRHCSGQLALSDLEGLLVFGGHPWTIQSRQQGRFLTSCEAVTSFNRETAGAKSALSLGYFPTYSYNIVPGERVASFCDSFGQSKGDGGASKNLSRVWPAFGETGGGWETLLLSSGAMDYGNQTTLCRKYPDVALGFRANSTRPMGMPFLAWRDELLPSVLRAHYITTWKGV
jgi:hypothetical protein